MLTQYQIDNASAYIAGASITQAHYGRKLLIAILTGLVEILHEPKKLDRGRFFASILVKERAMKDLGKIDNDRTFYEQPKVG